MSGRPQDSGLRAAESKAPIEPTAANASSRLGVGLLVGAGVGTAVEQLDLELAAADVAGRVGSTPRRRRVACCADSKMPGTGPEMSATLAIVIVLSVMPVWFLKPEQLPAGPAGRGVRPRALGGPCPPPYRPVRCWCRHPRSWWRATAGGPGRRAVGCRALVRRAGPGDPTGRSSRRPATVRGQLRAAGDQRGGQRHRRRGTIGLRIRFLLARSCDLPVGQRGARRGDAGTRRSGRRPRPGGSSRRPAAGVLRATERHPAAVLEQR